MDSKQFKKVQKFRKKFYKEPKSGSYADGGKTNPLWTLPGTDLTFQNPEPLTGPIPKIWKQGNRYYKSVTDPKTGKITGEVTKASKTEFEKTKGLEIHGVEPTGAAYKPLFDVGGYITPMLSDAITGAQIGTQIAPGIGTGIGAGAGLLAGAAQGFFAEKAEKEARKNELRQTQEPTFYQQPSYFKEGGISDREIEVEGGGVKGKGELEVKNGKVLKDFGSRPRHKDGGYTYEAKPGRVIIPIKDREKYLKSDSFTRNSMERRLILDQRKREKEKAALFDEIMKSGGLTSFDSFHKVLSPSESLEENFENIGQDWGVHALNKTEKSFKKGGYVTGYEIEVSDAELEQLKKRGYKFRIVNEF